MSEFLGVLRWITINIFGEASILIGLIVLLGLVLQKKSLADIVSGSSARGPGLSSPRC